jgi:hypothetical protein
MPKRIILTNQRLDNAYRAMVRNNRLHLSLRTRLLIQGEALAEILNAPNLRTARSLAKAALEEVAGEEWRVRKEILQQPLEELPQTENE